MTAQTPDEGPTPAQPPATEPSAGAVPQPRVLPAGEASAELRAVRHLEAKAVVLLLAFLMLLTAAVGYLLYARGVFEPKQQVVLLTDDSDGVVVGMDMTFSGFPIGRVSRIELAEDGQVRVLVDVPTKDARWLRTSSVVTLEKGVVGGAKLKAYTGVLEDPPLPDGAELMVLRGDLSAEIPKLVASVQDVLRNITELTSSEAALNKSLRNLDALTGRLSGQGGALQGLVGEADSKKLGKALDNVNALMTQLNRLSGKADQQVFGRDGVVTGAQETVKELNVLLRGAQDSLKQVDQVLRHVEGVTRNAEDASTDLGALRADVDASLRKVDALITQLNRKWPFAPKAQEVTLP